MPILLRASSVEPITTPAPSFNHKLPPPRTHGCWSRSASTLGHTRRSSGRNDIHNTPAGTRTRPSVHHRPETPSCHALITARHVNWRQTSQSDAIQHPALPLPKVISRRLSPRHLPTLTHPLPNRAPPRTLPHRIPRSDTWHGSCYGLLPVQSLASRPRTQAQEPVRARGQLANHPLVEFKGKFP